MKYNHIASFVNFTFISLLFLLGIQLQAQVVFADTDTNANAISVNTQAQNQGQNQSQTSTHKQPRLLVVPLDNRPANTYYPKKVGQAGGVEVILPPQNLIHHQTASDSLDQLSAWILENSDAVDGFIISADMLTDGGLVDSRTSKQTTDGALQQLQIIKALKGKHPTKPLYVYDTIQRLAPTVLKDGNLEKYNLIRDWAITYDEVKNLNKIDLSTKLIQLETKIGSDLIDEYKQIRNRNSTINATLVDWTEQGYIDYLVLGQDDANQTGLHRKEQENLIKKIKTNNIQHKVSVFDGADEVDVILISRFLATLKNYQTSFKIHYLGVSGTEWISPFDHYTLQTNIAKHVIAAGGIIASPSQQANIEVYVNTPNTLVKNNDTMQNLLSTNVEKNDAATGSINDELSQAVPEIKRQIANGKHVVFIDVEKVNQANQAYGDAIINDIGITNLLSYSAFNTAGNAIGTAIGHANSRFLYLEKGPQTPEIDEYAAKGQVEFLLNSLSSDHIYRNKVAPKTEWYVRYIGGNAWDIGPMKKSVLFFTNEQFNKEFDLLHSKVKGSKVVVSKKTGTANTAEIDNFSLQNIDMPWNRLFEVEFDFGVNFK
ncbi:MAG TPA: DUF4127 family protein [Bacillales bacterium]|nr:DUF4127 family protein [Bacillales bacterium]